MMEAPTTVVLHKENGGAFSRKKINSIFEKLMASPKWLGKLWLFCVSVWEGNDNMRTIKIKYVGFWDGLIPEDEFLTQILKKHYQVEISDEPEYVICSCVGFYDYVEYPQVRIMFSGENYVPDFNLVDYAISFYPIDFVDRHLMVPGIVLSGRKFITALQDKDRNYPDTIVNAKPYFANMIASHESEGNLRGKLLKLFEGYKRVESAGTFQNNMPDGQNVSRGDGTKLELQRKCKFTLCAESVAHEGFITEKIYEAFLADTIPIYYGSSTVSHIFNRNAYIDIRDYETLEDVLARVIELDSDDEKYLEMLRQPIFVQENYIADSMRKLEEFLCYIIDQPVEKAYRRCKLHAPAIFEEELRTCRQWKFNAFAVQYHAAKEKCYELLRRFRNRKA